VTGLARPGGQRRLGGDERGATLVEFALIAPIFLMVLLALCDIGQASYANSVLAGAVQQAARTSSLETGDTTAADARVEEIVQLIAPGAEVDSSRVSYFDFADVGRPESWNDADGNGTCSKGETYVDENGNGYWDPDIGQGGNGGAGDVVIYSVEVTYPPLFGVPLIPGGTADRTISASAVKKNQPFADQPGYGSKAGSCE